MWYVRIGAIMMDLPSQSQGKHKMIAHKPSFLMNGAEELTPSHSVHHWPHSLASSANSVQRGDSVGHMYPRATFIIIIRVYAEM